MSRSCDWPSPTVLTDAREHTHALTRTWRVRLLDFGRYGCAITTPYDRSSTASCLRYPTKSLVARTRPESAFRVDDQMSSAGVGVRATAPYLPFVTSCRSVTSNRISACLVR
jgi:hypothetical protein